MLPIYSEQKLRCHLTENEEMSAVPQIFQQEEREIYCSNNLYSNIFTTNTILKIFLPELS